jgi:dTDP-4-amino-4,6-dideoxygalactose transaminase
MARIHLSKADITEVEERYVLDAVRSGWVAPLGPHVDAFEAEVARRVGVQGALALSSGTAALHLALLLVGARPGSVVLVPSMTFAASANAVVYTGAEPVFVDVQASDGNVDPQLLIEAVDTLVVEGRRIAAVMAVDLFGRCVDYPAIVGALVERGIPLVEDAAEALGAGLGQHRAGSFGIAAALSFNGNKIMTTSGGGMLLSNDSGLIEQARYLSTQARQPVPWYEHTDIGYNYRLSNVLAALGRGQLTRLDDMIARRRQIRAAYVAALSGIDGLRFLGPSDDRSDSQDNCWLTAIVLDPALNPMSSSAVIKVLNDAEIEARHLWKPMHAQPVFSSARAFTNGTSEQLFEHGLCLPSGSSMDDRDLTRTLDVLRSVLTST